MQIRKLPFVLHLTVFGSQKVLEVLKALETAYGLALEAETFGWQTVEVVACLAASTLWTNSGIGSSLVDGQEIM